MLTKLLFKIFPPRCLLCHARGQAELDLCGHCIEDLPQLSLGCSRCAHPLEIATTPNTLCGNCLREPPAFDRTVALWRYDFPLAALLTTVKFKHNPLPLRALCQRFSQHLKAYYRDIALPQALIPMPLHRERLRERGYNQALLITRFLQQHTHLPVLNHVVTRHRATQAQSLLSTTTRRTNVVNAFSSIAPVPYQHVAIVDDILTTGSTAAALSQVLKQQGCATVTVWVLARTVRTV